MLAIVVFVVFGAIVVQAQVPSFGRCPEYDAMPDFDKERFLGKWYEIERSFSVTDVVSKCISATYERRADGKIYVNNHYTNRINNVKRIISGRFSHTGKGGEGRFVVKYETFPLTYDASLVMLDTDYDNYAVIWSCSNIGPFGHTESSWLMARERIPRGEVLQAAYGVLDKYKMNRSFFVKTEQTNCETLPPPLEAIDPTNPTVEIKKMEPEPAVSSKDSNESSSNESSSEESNETIPSQVSAEIPQTITKV